MNPQEPLQVRIAEAAASIHRHWQRTPRVAIILGTGLGGVAEQITSERTIDYRAIAHFPESTAPSHRNLLVCGLLERVPVVAMSGRCHLYEGYAIDHLALPVRVLHALGAGTLIVSNASGGLNPQFAAGDVVALVDHINLMWDSPWRADQPLAWNRCPRPAASPYDPELVERALQVARRHDVVAYRGVYVAVTGPTYETRAEYRMFRRIGGDVVGMSTVPEVIAAAQCGMRTLALSLVTNVARPDAPQAVQAQQVVAAARRRQGHLASIVRAIVAGFAAESGARF